MHITCGDTKNLPKLSTSENYLGECLYNDDRLKNRIGEGYFVNGGNGHGHGGVKGGGTGYQSCNEGVSSGDVSHM